MKLCLHILIHEIKKIFLDRKLLISIFFVPFVIVLMISFLSWSADDKDEKMNRIYVLNNVMERQTIDDYVEFVPVDYVTIDELTDAKLLEKADAVLQITDTEIVIYYNSTDTISVELSYFCEQMLTDRMLEKFASINMVDVSSHILVEDVTSHSRTGNGLMEILLPYMLVLLLLQSVSEYSIDTIAGEKERGVFSKTLLTPVSPTPVIAGKILSCMLCGLISCGMYFLIAECSYRITGLDIHGLHTANITPIMIMLIALYAVLLSCFFASLTVLCSLYSSTVKEAKAAIIPVFGITIVLAILSILRSGTISDAHYFIPIYNVCIVIQDILTSSLELDKMLITAVSLLDCSYAFITVTAISFKLDLVRY